MTSVVIEVKKSSNPNTWFIFKNNYVLMKITYDENVDEVKQNELTNEILLITT